MMVQHESLSLTTTNIVQSGANPVCVFIHFGALEAVAEVFDAVVATRTQ
jgi:hypothetical protein